MKKIKNSLYGTMFAMTILPMVVLGIIIAIFCKRQFTVTIYHEVETSLQDICALAISSYDEFYPGDFHLEGEEQKLLYKGDKILNGNYKIIDTMKENTGIDITLFYYDTRALTTITNENGERIIGTRCNEVVFQDVYVKRQTFFYKKAEVNDEEYFCLYRPIYNSDGSCVGMIFAGKPSREILSAINHAMLPTTILIIGFGFLSGGIGVVWIRKTIAHLRIIQKFQQGMTSGKFSKELNPDILKRKDEIGIMGRSMVQVQSALKELVEKDVLTGLNNRRFGIIALQETRQKAEISGMPYAIALGDIDFFKRCNDTYGHDFGDLVLQKVSAILKMTMLGRGYAVRWGGEEFLLIFNRYNADMGEKYLMQGMEEIRNMEVKYGEVGVHITMTFGIADGLHSESIDACIKEADDKLYYGKEHGRNQIVRWIPEEREETANGESDDMESPSV